MKTFAFILNFFLPGVGSLMVGKIIQGIIQICLFVVAVLLSVTAILAILGIPLGLINVIWATYCVAVTFNMPDKSKSKQYRVNS
jgi:TM2 domain-containing membrane protein YozV